MQVLITISAGADAGPFNLYQNSDGFVTAFATGIAKATLVAGYTTTVNDASTVVRVKSTGVCTTQVDLSVSGAPTTTSTTTLYSTTTTTTGTPLPCISYEVCANDGTDNKDSYPFTYTGCSGIFIESDVINGQCRQICAQEGTVDSTAIALDILDMGPC